MNDQQIEQKIKSTGADVAPRITPEDLDANIVHVEIVKHIAQSGQVLRWAVLTTRCGYAVTGRHSAAVSSGNDRAEVGEQIAIDNARGALWELMGYELRSKLAAAPIKCEPKDCPHAAPFRYCPSCVEDPCPIGLVKPAGRV